MEAGLGFALSFRRSARTLLPVNRLSKAILITCVSLGAVTLLAILAVNLYLQSPGTQARIQEELRRGLRIPLRITSTSVTPWGGLRISGITIPAEGANFLQATSFNAKYQLLPLLRKKLIIDSMVLDRPQIVWTQNDKGKWVLPALPESADEPKKPKTSKPEGSLAETPVRRGKEGRELEVVIKGFEIRNAMIEFWDKAGTRVAQGSGVEMLYTTMREDRMEGTLRIGQLAWRDSVFLTKLESPFRYANGEIALTDLQAELAGGTLTGKASVNPEAEDAPFRVQLAGQKIDLGRASTEAGLPPGQATGTLTLNVELEGNSREAHLAEGKGSIHVANAHLKQLEFFQTLGQVLQIPELADLRLREGRADFRIADEKAFIEDMLLQTPDLQLGAKGLLRIDGKVQLDARLGLSERLTRQLPSALRENLTAADSTGVRSIPFKITGKLDRPKTDLLDSLIGGKIGSQFDDFVSNIFGLKKNKPDDKKEKDRSQKKKKGEPKIDEKAAVGVGTGVQ